MDEKQLNEIEARLGEALGGPWHVEEMSTVVNSAGAEVASTDFAIGHIDTNAEFIANSWADIRDLLAEVRRLQEDCRSYRDLARAWEESAMQAYEEAE